MPIRALRILLVPLLVVPLQAHTAIVQRCEGADGHITFTSLGCPSGQTQHLHNTPGSPPSRKNSEKPAKPAFRESPSAPASKRNNTLVTVVGDDDDGCSNLLNRTEKRQAIINHHIRPGMNTQEVESVLGKPDKISKKNGTTRYSYAPKKGRSAQVVFDEKGCVKR